MTSQQNRTTLRTTRSAGRTGLGTLLFTALFGAAACTGAPPDAADPIAEDPAAVGQVALEAGNIAGWEALGATSAPGHIRRLIALSGGGYAAIVENADPDATEAMPMEVYRWNGLSVGAVWTKLAALPGADDPNDANMVQVNDIAEWEGRLYAVGAFKWIAGTCYPAPETNLTICGLYDFRQNIASYPLAANVMNPRWAPLKPVPMAATDWVDDLVYSFPAIFHVVATGTLKGLYLAGGGLKHCEGTNDPDGCPGPAILRLIPYKLLGDGLGSVAVMSPGGTRVQALATGMLALTHGATPVPVIVVGGAFHVTNTNGIPLPNGFGLGAWDGTNWHTVATGLYSPITESGDLPGQMLQPAVTGVAFLGSDLYVSGGFDRMPVDPTAPPNDPIAPITCQGSLPDSRCYQLNGFARVHDARWQVLHDSRFLSNGVSEWTANTQTLLLQRYLVAQPETNSVYVLGQSWIGDADTVDHPKAEPPFGTLINEGTVRWREGKWEALQGGVDCDPEVTTTLCNSIIHDGLALPNGGMLFAGNFTQVGRKSLPLESIATNRSVKLARYFPTRECTADLDNTGAVGGADLAYLLSSWGVAPAGGTAGDFDSDGTVGGSDLATLLSAWGPCAL